MTPINFKEGAKTFAQAMSLTKEREVEIDHQMKLIVHELQKPLKAGEKPPPTIYLLKKFLEIAKNDEERVYCTFIAGLNTEDLNAAGLLSNRSVYNPEGDDNDDCDCPACTERRKNGGQRPFNPNGLGLGVMSGKDFIDFLSSLQRNKL